jgi:hypothetical protein
MVIKFHALASVNHAKRESLVSINNKSFETFK